MDALKIFQRVTCLQKKKKSKKDLSLLFSYNEYFTLKIQLNVFHTM